MKLISSIIARQSGFGKKRLLDRGKKPDTPNGLKKKKESIDYGFRVDEKEIRSKLNWFVRDTDVDRI